MNASPKPDRMNAKERALLDAAASGTTPLLSLRTQTRVDTGDWIRRSPLWLCVTESEIILLTAGRRQHSEKVTLREISQGWYCHTTGQLVLEPGERLRFRRVDLSPTDALQVLKHIGAGTATTQRSPAYTPET